MLGLNIILPLLDAEKYYSTELRGKYEKSKKLFKVLFLCEEIVVLTIILHQRGKHGKR